MKKCPICKVVALLAGIGAVNWGLVAFLNIDLVSKLLGPMTLPAKVVYGLVAVSGVLTLVSIVKQCPCGSK